MPCRAVPDNILVCNDIATCQVAGKVMYYTRACIDGTHVHGMVMYYTHACIDGKVMYYTHA